MAINPHIAHHRGSFRRLRQTKKRVVYRLTEKKKNDPIIHFVEYRPKSRQSSLYLDDGDNQFERGEDTLLVRDRPEEGVKLQRKGRFVIDIYRVESPPDLSDKQPGWVGPGTLIGYSTQVNMDNGLNFEFSTDLF